MTSEVNELRVQTSARERKEYLYCKHIHIPATIKLDVRVSNGEGGRK